jgi:hypothetical protein
MIDPTTGALLLQGELALDATLSPRELFQTPLGEGATPFVFNPPWESFLVRAVCRDGTPVYMYLFFRDNRLKRVSLHHAVDPSIDEDEVKLRHEAWLRGFLGEPRSGGLPGLPGQSSPLYTYDWGQVESEYDPRADSSDVIITYGDPEP